MGVDAADFNNDGRPDLVVLDMLPEREEILKTSANAESFNVYNLKLKAGYHPQYARNTLQLNRGAGGSARSATSPASTPPTGAGRRSSPTSTTTATRISSSPTASIAGRTTSTTSTTSATTRCRRRWRAAIDHRGEPERCSRRCRRSRWPSYAFRNNGDLTFTNMARGLGTGAAGLLERRRVRRPEQQRRARPGREQRQRAGVDLPQSRARDNGNHYLDACELLRRRARTRAGIGAKVIRHDTVTRRRLLEQMPTRGFQSSVDPRLHFGLGAAQVIDSLIVIWPDRALSGADQRRCRPDAHPLAARCGRNDIAIRNRAQAPAFADVTRRRADRLQRTTRTRSSTTTASRSCRICLSTEGPALAVGDVNGDGLDDMSTSAARSGSRAACSYSGVTARSARRARRLSAPTASTRMWTRRSSMPTGMAIRTSTS